MRARTLIWLGTALAVLSLGLPWRFLVGTPGYLTGGSYPGTESVARFFIVAAVALALIGGLHLRSARHLRWAAYVGVAGVLLHVHYGLMGGLLAMAAASVCFWLAARRLPDVGDVGVTG
jgi:hypothetical protein